MVVSSCPIELSHLPSKPCWVVPGSSQSAGASDSFSGMGHLTSDIKAFRGWSPAPRRLGEMWGLSTRAGLLPEGPPLSQGTVEGLPWSFLCDLGWKGFLPSCSSVVSLPSCHCLLSDCLSPQSRFWTIHLHLQGLAQDAVQVWPSDLPRTAPWVVQGRLSPAWPQCLVSAGLGAPRCLLWAGYILVGPYTCRWGPRAMAELGAGTPGSQALCLPC